MLAQRIERIKDDYRAEGEQLGLEKGERVEAERLFVKLYTVKNGGNVPHEVHERAAKAKRDQLETWAERLLTVERAEDVFDN